MSGILPIQGRPTAPKTVHREKRPLAANVVVRKGYVASVTAAGYFQEATGAAGERAVGIFYETVDNSAGTAGAKSADIHYQRPRFLVLLDNDTGTACVIADREREVFILDAHTATMATGKSAGAICYDVTSEGVWVEFVTAAPAT